MTDENRIAGDPIGLLDMLVTMAENWLLLVLVPILAGLAAYGAASLHAGTWRSSAVVGLPQAEVSRYLRTVFDGEAGWIAGAGVPVSDIERGLATVQGSSAERTRIELRLADPGTAERVLEAVLAHLSAAVEDGAIIRPQAQVAAEIAALAEEIAVRERIIATLTLAMEESEAAAPFDAAAYAQTASTLNGIMNARDAQRARQAQLAQRLAALPTAVVEQQASPAVRVGRSPVTVAVFAFLATGAALLMLVFVRAGLKSAAADPQARDKIDRIRRAFRLAPRQAHR